MARDTVYDLFKKKKSIRLRGVRHRVEFLIVRLLLSITNLFSVRANQFFGERIGKLAYYVAKKDRGIALYQLDFCFPNASHDEKVKIVKGMFVNLGKTLFETLVIQKIRREKERWIELRNTEVVEAARKMGNGSLMIFGHIGNWELIGIVCEMLHIRGICVSAPVKGKEVNKLLAANRHSESMRMVERGGKTLALSIIKNFRNNEFLIIALDQDIKVDSVFVDFFGKRASTSKNAAILARKYNAPVISAIGTRQKNGTHVYRFELLSNGVYRGDEEEIAELTQTYTTALENHIRRHPSQWVWNHRRWKTSPD